MGYYMMRIVIGVVAFCVIYWFGRKRMQNRRRWCVFSLAFGVVLGLALCMVPFENALFGFSSYEKAFRYQHTEPIIISAEGEHEAAVRYVYNAMGYRGNERPVICRCLGYDAQCDGFFTTLPVPVPVFACVCVVVHFCKRDVSAICKRSDLQLTIKGTRYRIMPVRHVQALYLRDRRENHAKTMGIL